MGIRTSEVNEANSNPSQPQVLLLHGLGSNSYCYRYKSFQPSLVPILSHSKCLCPVREHCCSRAQNCGFHVVCSMCCSGTHWGFWAGPATQHMQPTGPATAPPKRHEVFVFAVLESCKCTGQCRSFMFALLY